MRHGCHWEERKSREKHFYGAPFVKILYLADLAQKLISLRIYSCLCRDLIISGRDSYLYMQRCYLCMQRCYLCQISLHAEIALKRVEGKQKVCILRFFDSQSSRVYCDNATRWCVFSTLLSGKKVSLSSSFPCAFSMTAFFSLQYSARLQASTSLSALFLWEHSLFAPEGAQRWWAAPGENSWNGRT